jgi:hypothetical protein
MMLRTNNVTAPKIDLGIEATNLEAVSGNVNEIEKFLDNR